MLMGTSFFQLSISTRTSTPAPECSRVVKLSGKRSAPRSLVFFFSSVLVLLSAT